MTDTLISGDIVVVKFPFASSLKYKARPAVVISTENYNKHSRGTFIIMAIFSQVNSRLSIEKNFIIQRLGSLKQEDKILLNNMLKNICNIDLG